MLLKKPKGVVLDLARNSQSGCPIPQYIVETCLLCWNGLSTQGSWGSPGQTEWCPLVENLAGKQWGNRRKKPKPCPETGALAKKHVELRRTKEMLGKVCVEPCLLCKSMHPARKIVNQINQRWEPTPQFGAKNCRRMDCSATRCCTQGNCRQTPKKIRNVVQAPPRPNEKWRKAGIKNRDSIVVLPRPPWANLRASVVDAKGLVCVCVFFQHSFSKKSLVRAST